MTKANPNSWKLYDCCFCGISNKVTEFKEEIPPPPLQTEKVIYYKSKNKNNQRR